MPLIVHAWTVNFLKMGIMPKFNLNIRPVADFNAVAWFGTTFELGPAKKSL